MPQTVAGDRGQWQGAAPRRCFNERERLCQSCRRGVAATLESTSTAKGQRIQSDAKGKCPPTTPTTAAAAQKSSSSSTAATATTAAATTATA